MVQGEIIYRMFLHFLTAYFYIQYIMVNHGFQKKCVELEEKSKNNTLELEKVQMEMSDYRKQVSQLEMELESLRGTNDYLERNLAGKISRSA